MHHTAGFWGALCNIDPIQVFKLGLLQTAAFGGHPMFHKWKGMTYKLDCF